MAGRLPERASLERRLDDATPERPVTLGRYLVLRRVGAGGMGVVYEARDQHRQRIALKIVRGAGSAWLYHLKNEFRSVAGVAHPNLVALYELVAEGDDWYCTMEFVEGRSFVEYVGAVDEDAGVTGTHTTAALATGTREVQGRAQGVVAPLASSAPEPQLPSIARLRAGLLQLASGVNALHQAGKLHRDLKPSNLLVEDQGRVVVLDFGLASGERRDPLTSGRVEGTPAYMAPEQAAGKPALAASDWYAVGGILYRALTGRPPFTGSAESVLSAKQREAPPRPSTLVRSVPPDLDELCMALLEREPEDRPRGAEILRRLGAAATPLHRDARLSRELVGREPELQALLAAQSAVAPGRPGVVYVWGLSGVGKTALVRGFESRLERAGEPLILSSRCHACESVPYKVFDGIIDALGRHLARFAPEERAALVPEDSADLAVAFPALQALCSLRAAPLDDQGSPEARLRAFRSLKEILRRLSLRRPLVLIAEDLQWGDLDSAQLLRELLSEPDAPGLLFVGTARRDEANVSPFLREVASAGATGPDARNIALGPLHAEAAVHLARALLGGDGAEAEAEAHAIAAEAAGNPFFMEELVRYARVGEPGGAPTRSRSIEGVIQARLALLPAEARKLLAIVAVAGVSLEQSVALAAAGVGEGAAQSLHLLRAGNLIRTGGTRDDDGVETYHDRIRESLVGALSAETRAGHHLALGHALEATGNAEAEVLARHFMAGGLRDRAHDHALRAAERAAVALAFDRAASLYELALEVEDGGPEARRALTRKRADALVNSGRCIEAAPCYLVCADGVPLAEALQLRRRAAEQFLVGGRFDQGIAVLRRALADGGLTYPRTPRQALDGMLLGFSRLGERGLGFRERRPDQVPEAERVRVHLAVSASRGLAACDMTRGAYFTVEALLLALDAGDPHPIARMLAAVGLMMVYDGSVRGVGMGTGLIEEARRLARALDDAALVAVIDIASAIGHQTACRFQEAVSEVDPPVRVLEELRAGHDHERSYGAMTGILALEYLGRIDEVVRRAHESLGRAEATGSLYARVQASIYIALGRIAGADPRGAAELVKSAMALWPSEGFLFQHWLALKTATYAELYAGEARAALGRVTGQWPAFKASGLLRMQFLRIFAHHLRAGASLAVAAVDPAARKRLIAAAERDAGLLEREGMPIAEGAAALVRAGAATLRRRPEAALGHLETAIQRYETADMAVHVAVARRRKGQLLGGDAGRSLLASADRAMAEAGIVEGARWTAMYAPGFG